MLQQPFLQTAVTFGRQRFARYMMMSSVRHCPNCRKILTFRRLFPSGRKTSVHRHSFGIFVADFFLNGRFVKD